MSATFPPCTSSYEARFTPLRWARQEKNAEFSRREAGSKESTRGKGAASGRRCAPGFDAGAESADHLRGEEQPVVAGG